MNTMYTLPATLTIKNLKKAGSSSYPEKDLWNTGLASVCSGEALHPSATLDDCVPPLNTEKYDGTVQIPVYGNYNQYYTLAPEESMTMTVSSDSEAIFYLQMAEEGVLEVTSSSSGSGSNGSENGKDDNSQQGGDSDSENP